jgi:hypothetical protein
VDYEVEGCDGFARVKHPDDAAALQETETQWICAGELAGEVAHIFVLDRGIDARRAGDRVENVCCVFGAALEEGGGGVGDCSAHGA